jgi:1,4-alpha-glucan branching enzyme
MLKRLAADGLRDVLTLGVTPILAAQLDDPYTLRGFHDWLGDWSLRADFAGMQWKNSDQRLRDFAAAEHRDSHSALTDFEDNWRHGFSPILRGLVDDGVIELLGGPATHPFGPLLDERVLRFGLRTGLDDAQLRIGHRPAGIWAPECGYQPGMENSYAAMGISRFMVDGPSLHGDTATARPVGDSDVLCFGRDLMVSYQVWSPKSGYPGDGAYLDFHSYDHPSGLKPYRVTGKHISSEHKSPYEPALAAAAVQRHAADFVTRVVARIQELRDQGNENPLVVAAFDTELYGHWWHEGPQWLEAVLRALPEAGVNVTTLRGAIEAGHVGAPVELPPSSWGSGKDWRVWDGAQVADLVSDNHKLQYELLAIVDKLNGHLRNPALDQLAQQALLALSSDWAFMVSKDSAADYARSRAHDHYGKFWELARAILGGNTVRTQAITREFGLVDRPFGHLDARLLLQVP